MPAVSDLLRTTRDFRARLLNAEAAAARVITGYYAQAWQAISSRLDDLTAQMQDVLDRGGDLKQWKIQEAARLERLLSDLETEMRHFASAAAETVAAQRKASAEQGRDYAQEAMRATVPEGLHWQFSAVPPQAVETLIGNMEPGSPLGDLFDSMGTEASAAARTALSNGIIQGKNPREVARDIRDTTDMQLSRALTISRTEEIRAYRYAAIMNYQDNSDVVQGWVWSASLGSACELCTAMNGSVHSNDEFMDSHNNCRCSPVPMTGDWQDILSDADIDVSDLDFSDLEDTNADIPNGEVWFAQQSPEVQRKILGPSKAALYQTGQIKLKDIVAKTYDPRWGGGIRAKSLAELGFDAQDVKQAQADVAKHGPQTQEQSAAAQQAMAEMRQRIQALEDELKALSFDTLGARQHEAATAQAAQKARGAAVSSYGEDRSQWPAETRDLVEHAEARAAAAHEAAQQAAAAEQQKAFEAAAMRQQESVARISPDVHPLDTAATLAEVRDWLRTTFPDVTFNLAGATDLDQLKMVAKALGSIASDYPEVAAMLRVLGSMSDPAIRDIVEHYYPTPADRRGKLGRAFQLGEARPGESGEGIMLGARYLASRAAFDSLAAIQREDNWWQEGATDVGYVVAHEMGHVVQDWLEAHPDPAVRQAYRDWMARISEHMNLDEGISGYALTHPDEMFAEAFAALAGYGPDRLRDLSYVKSLQAALDQARASSEAFRKGKRFSPAPDASGKAHVEPPPTADEAAQGYQQSQQQPDLQSLHDALDRAQSEHANASGATAAAYQRMQDRYAQVVREAGAEAAESDPRYQRLRDAYEQAQQVEADAAQRLDEAQAALNQGTESARELAAKPKVPTVPKPTPEEKALNKAAVTASKSEAKATAAETKAAKAETASDVADAKLKTARDKLDALEAKREAAETSGKKLPADYEIKLEKARAAVDAASAKADAARSALAKARADAASFRETADAAHATHAAAKATFEASQAAKATPAPATVDIPASKPAPAAEPTRPLSPAEQQAAQLRSQIDDAMVQRDALYAQQSQLTAEQHRLENIQQHPEWTIDAARMQAQYDIYHQSLDQSDPNVKRYLKNMAAYNQAKADGEAALEEQKRLERVMDRLATQGKQGSAEWNMAKADYDAQVARYQKAQKAQEKTWRDIWTKSPGVYKPELDPIGGFELTAKKLGLDFSHIDSHPLVVAAREQVANLPPRIADIKTQISALDAPIRQANTQVKRQLAQLRALGADLRPDAGAQDTLRPFSDVLDLPEGHQPPNALMNKLDYRMHEPRAVTKERIIDDITTRLADNPDWQDYVARTKVPDLGRQYHDYIPDYASAKDTKSAQLVADLIKRWGVGYKPGSPQWVAMQMAVRDEFGLDSSLHAVTDAQIKAGESFYATNGAALRAFMRAMYDNTQQWFAEQGITEIEVYRGFAWHESAQGDIPTGITWGPQDTPNRGVTNMALNPFQSFSADINISQGSTIAGGFGGGFARGKDFQLLIGARVPVERVLSTAQTGFGAKLESEIVVMGRATDTVAYRAATRVEAALLRQAEETAVGPAETRYELPDGTVVRVVANSDRTFTLHYQDGPNGKLGALKVGSSKTYKSEKAVNTALKAMRFSNVYTAPEITPAADAMAPRSRELAAKGPPPEPQPAGNGRTVAFDDTFRSYLSERLGRDLTNEEIADLVAAEPGATLTRQGTSIVIRAADGSYERSVGLLPPDTPGGPMGLMNWTYSEGGDPNAPFPARLLEAQAKAAQALGIDFLHAKARDAISQDYMRLPQMGYDARIDDHLAAETRAKALPDWVRQYEWLSEVLATPRGRAWWRDAGAITLGLTFDLTPGSRSWQLLAAYLAAHPEEAQP